MNLFVNGQTEPKNGISTINSTVKMARLLNGQTEPKNGGPTENSTVKMARLLKMDADTDNGSSVVRNSPKKSTANAQQSTLAAERSLRLTASNTN